MVWIEIACILCRLARALVTTLRWCGLKLLYAHGHRLLISHHLTVVWIEIGMMSGRSCMELCHHLALVWIEISTFRLIDSY